MAKNLTNFYERGSDLADIYLGIDEVEELVLNRSLSTDRLSDIGFERLTCYTLWGWGNDVNKRLGINNGNTSIPVIVTTENCTWRSISLGSSHAVSLKCDGTLWSWGDNQFGQIGDNTNAQRFTPTQEISESTEWTRAIGGDVHTTAMKSDGTVWSWGFSGCGQVGVHGGSSCFSSPVQEISGSTWSEISTSISHVMAVKTDGTLWGWGFNAFGQLGNGAAAVGVSSPVQEFCGDTNWCAAAAGTAHSIALKNDGSLWGAGLNAGGEIGDGTTNASNSPVREATNSTNWSKISAGYFTSGAIKSDYTLFMWGSNSCGKLGDNTTVNKSSPTQEITQSQDWSHVSLSKSSHTTAIKTDGTLWSWGKNTAGELGNGSITNTSSPVQESRGIDTWIAVSAGNCNTIGLKK